MSYLLDTCALCGPTRKEPDPDVVRGLEIQKEEDLYLSVLSLGEIAKGVAKLDDSRRQRRLEAWLHTDLPRRFDGRIIDITDPISLGWGGPCGAKRRERVQFPVIEGLLSATASVHSLVVVTRNVDDFSRPGVPVFNPWEDAGGGPGTVR
jgi:predicted nucleic acid-binding protein